MLAREKKRVAIQFKIGSALLEEIDEHVSEGGYSSRNEWMGIAIRESLERMDPLPHWLTARHLLHEKVPLIVRMKDRTLKKVDRACDQLGMDRTLWLLDAMISLLAEEDAEV